MERTWNKTLWLIAFVLSVAGCVSSGELVDGQARFETYFNDPGTNQHNGIDPVADDKIVDLIHSAERSIYFSFYGFKRQNIVDALVDAINRGLDIEFAGDYNHYSRGESGYIQYEEALLGRPNVKLTVGNSLSIMHNKFMIIDERVIMTGTGNITDTGFERNNNSWTIIESPELAADFFREHQQMMKGIFGHEKTHQDFENIFQVNGNQVELYFSPYEDPMSVMLKALDEARSTIHYQIFAFTHDDMGRRLVEKHQQGISVRGVQDRSQFTHSQYVEIYRQAGACGFEVSQTLPTCLRPMDVKRDGNENTSVLGDWQGGGGRLHTKTILIDAGTEYGKVFTGSFNWSPNANNNNDENLLVIHSKEISQQFLDEWNKIYEVGIPLPGDQPGYQAVVISEVNWAGSMRQVCDTGCDYYPYDGNEYIELYNNTNEDIDISYWTLHFPNADTYVETETLLGTYDDSGDTISDFGDAPIQEAIRKRAHIGFAEGTVIPAKSYYVVAEPDQRNDNQNAYKNVDFSVYNELSNFISLNDRRNSDTEFDGCEAGFETITAFPSSNYWPVHNNNGAGMSVRLIDNRGNLIDIAGDGEKQDSQLLKGGFHLKSQVDSDGAPSDDSRLWRVDVDNDWAAGGVPDYECGSFTAYYMVSMERKRGAGNTFGDGSDWDQWDDASTVGNNIHDEFTARTLGTPGEANGNW